MKSIKITELQKQLVIVAIFIVGLVVVGVWMVITPSVKKMAYIQKEISQVDMKKETLKKIQDLKAQVDPLQLKLDKETQKNLVLSHLATLASRQKLEVESVTPEIESDFDGAAVSPNGIYRDLTIRIKAGGGFKQMVGFFGAIEKMSPKISVVQMELTNQYGGRRSGRQAAASTLAINLVLKTLLVPATAADKTAAGPH